MYSPCDASGRRFGRRRHLRCSGEGNAPSALGLPRRPATQALTTSCVSSVDPSSTITSSIGTIRLSSDTIEGLDNQTCAVVRWHNHGHETRLAWFRHPPGRGGLRTSSVAPVTHVDVSRISAPMPAPMMLRHRPP